VPGKPLAAFLCPGHPLLDTCIDLLLEKYRALLRRGALLLDSSDPGSDMRALFYLEHAIQDARIDATGNRRVVSRELQFVEIDQQGAAASAGPAPYLDYPAPDGGGATPGHAFTRCTLAAAGSGRPRLELRH